MKQMKVSRTMEARGSSFRVAILLILLSVSFGALSQTRSQLQLNNAYGYNYKSGAYRVLFFIPEDTLATADSGAVAFLDGRFYLKTGTYWADWGLRKVDDTTFVFAFDTLIIKPPDPGPPVEPGGPEWAVQFKNPAGNFAGSNQFKWDNDGGTLTIDGVMQLSGDAGIPSTILGRNASGFISTLAHDFGLTIGGGFLRADTTRGTGLPSYWYVDSIRSTFKNFATHDLFLTENRFHDFGTYGMKFGSGTNFDPTVDYVGIYSDGVSGIVLSGNSNNPTSPGMRFIDEAAPSVQTGMVNFYGQQQWYSSLPGVGTGTFQLGPTYISFGNTNSIRNKLITSTIGVRDQKGFRILDDIDSAGLFYHSDYKDTGLAVHGDRWIPDAGWVKTRIPDDFVYVTDGSECHDTTFISSVGYDFGHYELINLPAFKGHRIRVNAAGIQLAEDERWGGMFFQFNRITGELKIFVAGPCVDADPGQTRLIQAY